MKKILSFILTLILCVFICACESTNDTETVNVTGNEANNSPDMSEAVDLPESRLGNSIATDILRITLTKAQFAIKLNSSSSGTYSQIQSGKTTLSDKYFTPEEYNPNTDAGLAYIAAKGHTYVAIEFKAENLDRASVEFDGTFNDQFITVEYDGNIYNEATHYGCESSNGYEWVRYNSSNVLLLAGEEGFYRGYIDIPVDVADLNDDFALIFSLPNSKGDVTKFKYIVSAADRATVESQEISVEEAIHNFTKEDGQTYFKNHMDDYGIMSGTEIDSVVNGKKWNVTMKLSYGTWKGMFAFEADGRIKETIPKVGTGYFNSRTWSINEDTLILDNEDVCQVRKINDSTYLLVKDNKPYAILN